MPKRPFDGISSASKAGEDRKLPARRDKRKILFAHNDHRKWEQDESQKAEVSSEEMGVSNASSVFSSGSSRSGNGAGPSFHRFRSFEDPNKVRMQHHNNAQSVTTTLCELAAKESEASRKQQKNVLFNMFLECSENELQSLTKQSSDNVIRFRTLLEKEHKQNQAQTTACTKVYKKDDKLPDNLSKFHKLSKDLNVTAFSSDKKRRSEFAEKTIRDLEKEAMDEFRGSEMHKKSSYTISNPPQTKARTAVSAASTANSGISIEKKEESKTKLENSENFKPFSLLYNECSIVTICRWAGKPATSSQADFQEAGTPVPRSSKETGKVCIPTARSMFRKCSICSMWGHYDVECRKMKTEDVLNIGRAAKVQLIMREMVEKRPSDQASSIAESDGKGEQEIPFCDVCNSTDLPETMISCTECEKFSHFQCLDLQELPKDEWLCQECREYNFDVESDIETEECEGFVIEQQKRQCVNPDNDDNDYATSDSEMSDYGTLREEQADSDISVEETKLDGLVIKARRSSEYVPVGPVCTGSIVIWFSQASIIASSKAYSDSNTRPYDGHLAIVLAMNSQSQKSLVQEISLSRSESNSDNVSIVPGASACWVANNRLHAVGGSATTLEGDHVLKGASSFPLHAGGLLA